MRALAALSLVTLLCGCFEDNARQMASCELDASRAHPGKSSYLTANNWDGAVGRDVRLCMRAAGYVWTWTSNRCQPTADSVDTCPYCYRPSGPVSATFLRVELLSYELLGIGAPCL